MGGGGLQPPQPSPGSTVFVLATASVAQLAEHRTRFTRSWVRLPAGRPKVAFFRAGHGRVLKMYSDILLYQYYNVWNLSDFNEFLLHLVYSEYGWVDDIFKPCYITILLSQFAFIISQTQRPRQLCVKSWHCMLFTEALNLDQFWCNCDKYPLSRLLILSCSSFMLSNGKSGRKLQQNSGLLWSSRI